MNVCHRFRCHPTILSISDVIGKNNCRETSAAHRLVGARAGPLHDENAYRKTSQWRQFLQRSVRYESSSRGLKNESEYVMLNGPQNPCHTPYLRLEKREKSRASHPHLQLRRTAIRFWSGFPIWQITSAQHSGQLLTFQGKSCSHFRGIYQHQQKTPPNSDLDTAMKWERRREQCHPPLVLSQDQFNWKWLVGWDRRWKSCNVRRVAL